MAVGVVALLGACSGGGPTEDPGRYDGGLWPRRPQVDLAFTVADDLHSATGRETVLFTPDQPTCDLVFRAWPNGPSEAGTGAALVVTDASLAGRPVAPQVSSAGAAPDAPGTLIDIPVPGCLDPGRPVTATLDFRLTLGPNSEEVLGYSTRTPNAWFATAYPLLAWVRGRGWARDPALPLDGDGEFPTSEDYRLNLAVTAPSRYRVIANGAPAGDSPGPAPDTTTHRFTAPAVRDVTVGVGRLTVLDRDVDGLPVHLVVPHGDRLVDPDAWADQVAEAITGLTEVLGPFPYPQVWVNVIPGQNDGQEYPGAIHLGDRITAKERRGLVTHELAHQWFYALVGNDQAVDPWLDEALATYAEGLVGGDGDQFRYAETSRKVVGLMGEPLSYFADHGGSNRYDDAVYNQGAAVLLEARRRVGGDRFDPALRDYIARNAHRVAQPADFGRAFADQPEVLGLLRRAGALPGGAGG